MTLRRGAWIAFLLAVLARIVVLCAFDGGANRPLEGDEKGYAAVAGSLARGEGFQFTTSVVVPSRIKVMQSHGAQIELARRPGESDDLPRPPIPVPWPLRAFRAPLLSLVMAPVYALSAGEPWALRGFCALLGALSAPLAFLLATRLGGLRAGWIGGVAVACWPSNAWLSARVLSEPLDAVLLLAAADLLLRKRLAVGGAVLGLAILCRPGGLTAVVLAAGVGGSFADPGRRLRCAGAVLLAAAAVVAPWVARNWVIFGRPLLVTSSGVTLFGGNNPRALSDTSMGITRGNFSPGKWVPPEVAMCPQFVGGIMDGTDAFLDDQWPAVDMYGWRSLGEAESDSRFSGMAWTWMRGNPRDAAELACWKVVRFLDPDTRSEKEDAGRKAVLGWLSWGLALPAIVVALATAAFRRTPAWWMAVALLAGHLLTTVITYGDARMRAPVEPALLALLVAPFLAGLLPKWTAPAAPATLG